MFRPWTHLLLAIGLAIAGLAALDRLGARAPYPRPLPPPDEPSTLPPTAPPTPTPPPPTEGGRRSAVGGRPPAVGGRPPAVVYRRSSIVIPTYPYTPYLSWSTHPTYRIRFPVLDWGAYRAGHPAPRPVSYALLVLENAHLRLTLLPELGGRVYELVFKPIGDNFLYRNPVVKPAPWGPPDQGWWLAVGGLEWAFPVEEHGYEWGLPWPYAVVTGSRGITVTLWDTTATDRVRMRVAVHLPAREARVRLSFRLENPTSAPLPVKYWTTGMLAPGPANAPSADLRFLFPTQAVTVHSTGDPALPGAGEPMAWPFYEGRDMSRLGNWRQWLGFFEAPAAHGPFVAVYDEAADAGLVRTFPPAVARGAKGFAFGWSDPLPSDLWTDDGSGYVELHGGIAPTFEASRLLPAGGALTWSETWYPVVGIGGLTTATAEAALRLERVGDRFALGLYSPVERSGSRLFLWRRADCALLGSWTFPTFGPTTPFQRWVPAQGLSPDAVSLVYLDAGGRLLAGVAPQDCLPPTASVAPLPPYVSTTTVHLRWAGEDAWTGVVAYDLQVRDGYEGAWTDWLTRTAAISATFRGEAGHTYFFRVRAYDGAGNVGSYGDAEGGDTFTSLLITPTPVLVTSRKEVLTPFVGPEEPVVYRVQLRNTGNLTAWGLRLTDRLPAGLFLLSGSLTATGGTLGGSGGLLLWQGVLPPLAQTILTYRLTATAAAPLLAPLTNAITLTGDAVAPLVRRATVRRAYRAWLPVVVGR